MAQSRRYEGLEHLYREVYAPSLKEVRPAGRLGASMLRVVQGAGDWSGAATQDLVIGVTTVLQAPATVDLGGGKFSMRGFVPNAFTTMPPGFSNSVLVEGPHAVQILALPYPKLLAFAGEDAGLPSDGDFGVLHRGYNISSDVVNLLNRLWVGTRDSSVSGRLWADGLILEIAASLLHLRNRNEKNFRGGLATWQVARVLELMDAQLSEDVGLEELAHAVGLSTAHFSRAFKVSVGIAPHRWFTQRRIERAKSLLSDRSLGLTEIAQSVGFGGQSAFGVAFKRLTGLTPSEYRRLL